MKKLFVLVSVFCLLSLGISSSVYAWTTNPVRSVSSGEQTADATVVSGTCYIVSVLVVTDGTNDAKLVLKAGGSGGTVQYETTVIGSDHYGGRLWTFPVEFVTDCYADVTGTGASYIVEYLK